MRRESTGWPGARSSAGQSNGFLNRLENHASPPDRTTSENREITLASCLALLERERPDLALIVRAWDTLTETERADILATVCSANERRG